VQNFIIFWMLLILFCPSHEEVVYRGRQGVGHDHELLYNRHQFGSVLMPADRAGSFLQLDTYLSSAGSFDTTALVTLYSISGGLLSKEPYQAKKCAPIERLLCTSL
jgi:hypothetical protein